MCFITCYIWWYIFIKNFNVNMNNEHNQFWWLYNQLYQVTRRLYTLACRTFSLSCWWLYTLLWNTQIQCTHLRAQPPQILLHADLQQIESKAYLFTHHHIYLLIFIYSSAQRLNTLRASCCVSGRALVVGGDLLLCLLPVKRVEGGQHPRTPPHHPRHPGRRPRPPFSLRPRLPSYPFKSAM